MDTTDSASGLTSIHAPLPTRTYLAAMWDRREFTVDVPLEQMRSEHRTTLLGSMWHLVNPLLTVGVYYLVFATLLKADRGIDNYLLWLTIGVFAYRLTQNSVQGGATSLSSNMGLIRAIRFPRALLPVSVVISQLLTFAMELGVLAAFVAVAGGGISRRWLVLPLVVAVHTALNLGGAFIAARLNDAFRDIQQILPFVFRILLYLSGVMFPIERLLAENAASASWAATLVSYNPILRVIEFYRWVFLGSPLDLAGMARTVGLAALVLWFGFRYFPRRRVAVRTRMTAPLSIRVSDLHLDYEIFEDRRAAIRDRIVKRQGTGRSVVKALRGVSFDVAEGELVGVIGSNGSGKSTLLASIAGLLPPSSGEILVSEEPKLLGVGATLLPAATGYRNIRIGCLALGMGGDELDARMKAIADFTGLGEALDRPLRTYSSGMRARLHFAIATAVQPRILLIDEALAVGDHAFRKKSTARIRALLNAAGTVLIVSHTMEDILADCTRALWIEDGLLEADGPAADVVARYEQFVG